MESLNPQMVVVAKLPILNPNEFDLWKIRIEQYFLMINYSLWKVILNGDSSSPTRIVDGVVQIIAPTTTEQRLAKKNELKDRGTLLMRNKAGLEEKSLDDLFNNLKIYEAEVKGSSNSSHNTQNIAFLSSNNIDNTNESETTAPSITAASSKATVSTLLNVDSLSDAVIYSFFSSQSNSPQLDNEDLKQINPSDLEEMDLKRGHFTRECRSPKDNRNKDTPRRNVPVEVSTLNALVSQCDAVGGYDWTFQADEEPTNYALMAYASSGSSSSSRSDNEVASFSKACSKAYATLQTHYDNLIVEFRKPQFDVLSYKTGLESVEARLVVYQLNETVFEGDIKLLKLDVMLRDNALAELRKKFEKAKKERDELKLTLDKFQTSFKNLSKLLESQVSDKTGLGFDSQVFHSQVFNCEEFPSHESDNSVPKNPENDRYKIGEGCHVVPPPYTVTFLLSKLDLVFHDDPNASESVANVFNVKSSTNKPSKDMSKTLRPDALIIEDWISDFKDETKLESVSKQREPSLVPPSEHVKTPRESVKKGNPQQALKDKGVINSGCSRHMTGNISFLSDFEEINGGYVAFRGNLKGAKILCKGDLTCHFAKATLDESNLWHRRLGHINFKTMNKLVKSNLVRGLPSKIFKNNHTCVACQKGKQHRASCKSKSGSSVSNPLQRMKGIKREFHVARTPQQNRVEERKNITLIEAIRTMLADSLLPIPFWAEVVNTACYVHNRVLVTKPHNKIPYELLLGRSPSIGFMRPFGCPITILNTLDPLEKFDGKANEGFLVGYSVNSKAFRVFNSRTKIVQETLHINFLENKPSVARIGPKWLFDIDTLTKSMNYQPVVVRNQPNDNADPQNTTDDVVDVAFDVKENENDIHVSPSGNDKTDNKKHDDKAKIDDKGKSPVDTPTGVRDLRADFEEFSSTSTNRVNAVNASVNVVGPNPTNSTNSFNTASPSVNVVIPNFRIARKSSFIDPSKYPDDLNMPKLEDIVYSDDEEDVGAEADLSNLETNIPISPIPTIRVHKDHLVNQIIGELNSAPQTRSASRMVKEQGGVHNDENFHTYLPKGKRAIGSKWVFRNKKDERRIVIRNKARFVTQGHTQEEGIDYDEDFSHVMDVKSAFLYGTIEEEVYVCQPPWFEDLGYPDKVYKVVKALYGLHQAPRACDYARASLDKKSITRGCQFLGCRLISWQCKKQTVVATSLTEAKYVVVASCCTQVLWIQNQLLDYGIELASPKQTALGKDILNPFMAGSLPK
nr:hypothetical protein [Tanacetum cinerariifolium]